MPKPINMEWRAYDTNELTVTFAEHVGPFRLPTSRYAMCEACGQFREPTALDAVLGEGGCSIDITAAYRNLTRNLAAVVMAAAGAQAEREKVADWLNRCQDQRWTSQDFAAELLRGPHP